MGAAFLLITGPGAVDAWLSLIDRFVGQVEEPISVSIGDWYEAIFPILGLIILVGVILWIRNKEEVAKEFRLSASTESVTGSSSRASPDKEAITPSNLATRGYTPRISSGLIKASPSELTGLYRGVTTAEAEPKTARYIGKLIVVDGKVSDVNVLGYGKGGYSVVLDDKDSNVAISARFSREGNEDILMLQSKQEISILGTISEKYWIFLEFCRWPGLGLVD